MRTRVLQVVPMSGMSTEESFEWEYIYQERLGMLCEDREPSPEEVQMACKDANEAVKRMRK